MGLTEFFVDQEAGADIVGRMDMLDLIGFEGSVRGDHPREDQARQENGQDETESESSENPGRRGGFRGGRHGRSLAARAASPDEALGLKRWDETLMLKVRRC